MEKWVVSGECVPIRCVAWCVCAVREWLSCVWTAARFEDVWWMDGWIDDCRWLLHTRRDRHKQTPTYLTDSVCVSVQGAIDR